MPHDFGKLVQSFFDVSTENFGQACWCPSVDIYRGRDSWLVKFDLAGVRADDVQLHVQNRNLIVEGIRRDFSVLEDQQAYSMEISYNRFQRAVELPLDLTHAQIRSEYRDGMFLVLITPGSSKV
jgi:HSP20 family protein